MPGALVAVPEPQHVTAPTLLRDFRVLEGGPAVRELPVVEVLELALLDAELDPARGIVHDRAHRVERLPALVVERGGGQPLAVDDVVLVVTRGQDPALVLEHRVVARADVVGGVLALAIPRERSIETGEEVGPAATERVVRGHEAREAAQAALQRGLKAEETHEVGRLPEPAAVGVEGLAQVGDRAAHAVAERLAGVLHVVEPRAVGLLRDDLPEHGGEQPPDGPVLLGLVALDREAIHHREAGIGLELRPHVRHEVGARPQRERRGGQALDRARGLAQRPHHLVQLRHAGLGQRDQPPVRGDGVARPRLRTLDLLGREVLRQLVDTHCEPPSTSEVPGSIARVLDSKIQEVPPMRFSGVWLPAITPFTGGEIDYPAYERLIDHYVKLGVTGIIPLGTTGESPTIDDDEADRLVERTVATVAGRVPIVVGVGSNDTRKAVKAVKRLQRHPVQGILSVCPYYNRPSQDGMLLHFTRIAEATDRPILIYNIPYRTGVNLGNETLLRLAAHPNITGLKDCSADAGQSAELLRRKPASFAVLTGEDAQFHAALAQGADGGILASSHVETGRFLAVYQRMVANDHHGAHAAWQGLETLVPLLFKEPNPMPIKHCLWRQGLIQSPECRLPLTRVSEALARELDRVPTGAAKAGV